MAGVWMLGLAACRGEAPDPPPSLAPAGWPTSVAGELTDPRLAEVSGLASSARGTHLWAIEDGENEAVLAAVGPDGQLLARVAVDGVENVDWEDLAAFALDGAPHLLIADVGDNEGVRPYVELHAVPEPGLTDATAPVAWTTRFTWEGGPRDCEAVAVAGDDVVLVTKREQPPGVYLLPLRTEGVGLARRVGEVHHLPSPTPRDLRAAFGAFRSQPTALAVDAGSAILLTYKDAYVYARRAGWAETFAAAPRWVDLPQLAQSEALTIGGDTVIVTTEQLPAPLVRVHRGGGSAEGGSRTPTPKGTGS